MRSEGIYNRDSVDDSLFHESIHAENTGRGLLETILKEIGYDIERKTRSRLRPSRRELEAQSLFYAPAESREAAGDGESAG